MAIAFARPEYVGRSSGGNACCKSAYNARDKIKDLKTGVTYNWQKREGSVYHDILLPSQVEAKFKNIAILANEVERLEKRKDSQLYVEFLLALPKEKEITLDMKKEIIQEFIDRKEWIKEGLGVQVDIHKPHDGEINWHAHLLVTTRRFKQDGSGLESKKAVDLQPDVKYRKVQKTPDIDHHILYRDVLNDKFRGWGLDLRADLPGEITQEHIGPVRMRSVLNQAMERNEERRTAEIEHLSNGAAVLDKVTSHLSVFSESDLMRAVKYIPDIEKREELVKDALASESVVALFSQDGDKTRYFTTSEIREEEERILDLSDSVANNDNIFKSGKNSSFKNTQNLVESAKDSLNDEQNIALREIVTSGSALRILRGRAGAGKSRVMRQLSAIAKASNISVIGLAPTHKAKEALASDGFAHTDTVKGMMFKLHYGMFSLPKRSLIVVDEAGMIGNDDLHELFRVAATRKCNVILSGDERQLASIQRGGMFEILAEKHGSSAILNVERQDSEWGKAVSMAFSKGDVRSGVSILKKEQRINRQKDDIESIQALLSDWSKSKYKQDERLILAVKNKDVAALNHGVREYLKKTGKLVGPEIEVGGNRYTKGDSIVIVKTNKELGVVNGDLGKIMEVTENRFVVSIRGKDNSPRIIEFDPSEYAKFAHGYAMTVFKAQGASIRDVYVFFNGFAGLRNSYVALSRNISELRLYINDRATNGIEKLIKQLSLDLDNGSSLKHLTAKDLERRASDIRIANSNIAVRVVSSALDFVTKTAIKMTSQRVSKPGYFDYQEPEAKIELVTQVSDRVYEEISDVQNLKHGDSLRKTTNTAKVSRDSDFSNNRAQRAADFRAILDNDSDRLRQETRMRAEDISTSLLGQPNHRLSNGRELRFGENGKVAVRIRGEKAGTWYDFSAGKGGDMFDLVQDIQGCDFKGAADYLRRSFGSDFDVAHLRLVHDHENSDLTIRYIKEQKAREREREKKQARVDKLIQRSKSLMETSVVFKYLTKVRGLNCDLGDDIKTARIYSSELGVYLPSLIAIARDSNGVITGGQQILLKTNGSKADIATPKKSFGRISGSFVNLGTLPSRVVGSDPSMTITIIAEGLETALSVKQALSRDPNHLDIDFKILCSLGVSNMGNYASKKAERVIIAADNDGESAITNKTVSAAKATLESRGSQVEIVKPKREGDFNDVLISSGERNIQDAFCGAIDKHKAITLNQYFRACKKTNSAIELNSQEKDNLGYIQRYNLPEKAIVEAYRNGGIKGKIALEQSRKSLEFAANCYEKNKDILSEAKRFGYRATKTDATKAMLGMDEAKADAFCEEMRNSHLESHLQLNINKFSEQKRNSNCVEEIKTVIAAEQGFLKKTYESLKAPIDKYQNEELMSKVKLAKIQYENKDFNKLELVVKKSLEAGTENEGTALKKLRDSNDLAKTRQRFEMEIALSTLNSQIDKEIAHAKSNNLIPRKVNLEKLKQLTLNYAFDKVRSQEFVSLSLAQTKALISRSVFELNNGDHIKYLCNGIWDIKNPDTPKPLSYALQCERIADKVTKVSGYLIEDIVLKNPEKHLSIKKDDSFVVKAYKIIETSGEKVNEIIKDDQLLKGTEHFGAKIQRSIAHQLVDYRLQHGMDVDITQWKLESMQAAAKFEHELSQAIETKICAKLTPGFDDYGVSDIEQAEVLSEAKKLVVHNLRDDIHQQRDSSEYDKNHCNITVSKSIKQISNFQRKLDSQRLEENEHQSIKQTKGIGMST